MNKGVYEWWMLPLSWIYGVLIAACGISIGRYLGVYSVWPVVPLYKLIIGCLIILYLIWVIHTGECLRLSPTISTTMIIILVFSIMENIHPLILIVLGYITIIYVMRTYAILGGYQTVMRMKTKVECELEEKPLYIMAKNYMKNKKGDKE